MNVAECITTRRSIRKYQNKPVDNNIINEIIDEVRFAPSWSNTKAIRFTCIKDESIKERISNQTSYNSDYIKNCSAVFVITALRNRSGTDRAGNMYYHTSKEWTMLDAGIAIQTLCLSAWSKGIGSLIIGDFDGDGVRKVLSDIVNLDESQEVVALVTIGYADEAPKAPKRKEVSDILTII